MTIKKLHINTCVLNTYGLVVRWGSGESSYFFRKYKLRSTRLKLKKIDCLMVCLQIFFDNHSNKNIHFSGFGGRAHKKNTNYINFPIVYTIVQVLLYNIYIFHICTNST